MGNTKALESLRELKNLAANYAPAVFYDEIIAKYELISTQLAERDAQLAAERAMGDRLARELDLVIHTRHITPGLDLLKEYKATRQPTQDKG